MFNKKTKRIAELEEVVEGMKKEREFLCDRLRSNEDLEKEINDFREKYADLEEKLKQTKKEEEYWFGQYQIMATKSTDYGLLVDKYLFENQNTDIDDEGVIYNHKVYKITGRKQIVDDYGDTLELKCILVDPKKVEKEPIGFKVKEPVIKDEEDK